MLFVLLPFNAFAAEPEEELTEESVTAGVDEIISALDLRELEEYYSQYRITETASLADAVKEISMEGLSDLTPEDALKYLKSLCGQAFKENIGTMIQLVLMLVVTGVLTHLQTSFGNAGVAHAASRAGYIIVCGLAVSMLSTTVFTAREAMDKLFSLVEVLTPVLTTLLTGLGGSGSAAMMSPVMAVLTGSVAGFMKNIIFPVILVAAVIGVVSHMSTAIRLNKASAFIMSAVKWALGLVMVVFIGITAMKGLTSSAIDGLSFKTAKYTVGKAIPYVGGMFSDTLDTLLACGLIVKNAVGVIGLLMMAVMMGGPLIRVIVSMFLFKAAAAAAQPFAEDSCVCMLSEMGEIVKLIAIVLLTCTAMVFITVALFIGSADMSLMLR